MPKLSPLYYAIQSLKFFYYRRILHKEFLTAHDNVFDIDVRFVIQDGMGRRIFKQGSFQPDYANFILNLPLQKNDVILDIGANVGWYSMVLGKGKNKDIRVFSFEPEPLNFSLLEENLKINNLKNVVAVNKAVSDRKGEATLHLYERKNTGRHSLLDINSHMNKTVLVETIVLDEFLAENNVDFKSVRFIKIDIEGFEFFALRGGQQMLKHLPFMLLEFSLSLIRKGGDSPADFIFWLQALGYNFYNIDDAQPKVLSSKALLDMTGVVDLFLVNKDIDTFNNG